jgi:lipopolysaccharide cholinephosphotransferase
MGSAEDARIFDAHTDGKTRGSVYMDNYEIKKNPDGTLITVRDVQEYLLTMLKDIDALMRRNHIPYFLDSGTALGAIRHRGFIPWDDDADIGIMKEDYERFLEVMEHDLPDQYIFQCFEKDSRYNVLIPAVKIRMKGTYLLEKNFLLSNRCTGYDGCDGVFVDVFVYDTVSLRKTTGLQYRLFNYALTVPELIADNLLHINPVGIKKLFLKNAEKYSQLARKEKSDCVGLDLTWVWNGFYPPYHYKKSELFPTRYVKFEDTYLPVPHNYDAYLRRCYGDSYMQEPPARMKNAKHIAEIRL